MKRNQEQMNIADFNICEKSKTFIIAELSGNHLKNFDLTVKTLEAMKSSGADAVKVQTFTPDTITIDSRAESFVVRKGSPWDGKSLYEIYGETYMPWEWQKEIKEIAEKLGLIFFSSPFDKTAVDFLEKLDVPAYKIASLEITDIPLIEYVASKKKPVIISTGIAKLSEIDEAVEACRRVGNDKIALLKCTTTYPAPLEETNLLTMPNMGDVFGTIVGLSDHTLGISVPIAAVSLGAKIVEKHFILDRSLGGNDSSFSLQPNEFGEMVKSIRDVEQALGTVTYEISDKTKKSRQFARSLFVVTDIAKGDEITEDNVRSIRPGTGLAPRYLPELLGKKIRKDTVKGTPLKWDLID